MDIPNYELKEINDNLINVFVNNKKLKICINDVLLPYGLESYDYLNKKKFFIQAELPKKDIDFFKNFEFSICDRLNIKRELINTQINKRFDDKLKINIDEKKNKILTKLSDCDDKLITIFDIKINQKSDIFISPIVFRNNEKFILKWSLIELKCV